MCNYYHIEALLTTYAPEKYQCAEVLKTNLFVYYFNLGMLC